jgi:hypothetical protein
LREATPSISKARMPGISVARRKPSAVKSIRRNSTPRKSLTRLSRIICVGPPDVPLAMPAKAWRWASLALSSTTQANTQSPSDMTGLERMTSANFRPSSETSP